MSTPGASLSEAHFQAQVTGLASFYGWRWFHAPDNRPSASGRRQTVVRGWPDLFLVRGAECLAVELKTEKGRLRPEQDAWLGALAQVPGIECHIWRPSSFDELHARLARGRSKSQPLYRQEAA